MQSSGPQIDRKRIAASSTDVTRERLLDAAAQTFSRDGIQGATTREIARGAGVNEVTLFRHFKSKEQLLRAVLQRGLAAEAAVMDQHSSWKEDLRGSMEKYARHYYSHLKQKEGLARASKTVRGITGLHVIEHKASVENGKIDEYRVTMEVTFILEN